MTRLSAPFSFKLVSALVSTAFVLAACGGGGGDGGASSTETPESASTSSTTTSSSSTTTSTPTKTTTTGSSASTPAAASSSSTTSGSTTSTSAAACTATTSSFGTFDKPYAANSPWNSRPVNPVFGTDVIPTSSYYPYIGPGAYSTQAFKASSTDAAVTIYGATTKGVWDPDAEVYRPSVTIPHWPAGVTPATGSDGHAEIVDVSTGIVHSFWQLKQVNGVWQAQQYAWTALNGRGFGDPSHYMQGARSAGVSTLGGLIRASEVNDGASMYNHALSMSMTYNGLSKSPTYVFPATSADGDAATANSGPFPLGSLMMLPPSFDTSTISNLGLRKVAQTLKTYGAYAVDRNYGTPYVIYAENNSGFNLSPNGWDSQVASDMQKMRAAMRRVMSAGSWVDGNGQSFSSFSTNLNLLSMRGYWWRNTGTLDGTFDTWQQAMTFPVAGASIQEINAGGRAYSGVTWGTPTLGANYKLVATTTGGATFRMTMKSKSTGKTVYDSGTMANGQSATFAWPVSDFVVTTYATSASTGAAGTATAALTAVDTTAATTTSTCPN